MGKATVGLQHWTSTPPAGISFCQVLNQRILSSQSQTNYFPHRLSPDYHAALSPPSRPGSTSSPPHPSHTDTPTRWNRLEPPQSQQQLSYLAPGASLGFTEC